MPEQELSRGKLMEDMDDYSEHFDEPSLWAKLSHGALDAIPDFTPVVGFADDLGALMMSAAVIAAHIKPKHRQQARQKLREYFGDQADTDDEDSQPASSAS